MEIRKLLNIGVSIEKQDNQWLLDMMESDKNNINESASCSSEIEDKKFDELLRSCNIDPKEFREW